MRGIPVLKPFLSPRLRVVLKTKVFQIFKDFGRTNFQDIVTEDN